LKSCYQLILDVRTSAHHLIGCSNQSKLFVASVTKVTESRQTVKLTLHHRDLSLVARYVQSWSIDLNQTAHISLQCSILSNNVTRQNQTTASQFNFRRNRSMLSDYVPKTLASITAVPDPNASTASVEGLLNSTQNTRNP